MLIKRRVGLTLGLGFELLDEGRDAGELESRGRRTGSLRHCPTIQRFYCERTSPCFESPASAIFSSAKKSERHQPCEFFEDDPLTIPAFLLRKRIE
jgi:hypothetical protein